MREDECAPRSSAAKPERPAWNEMYGNRLVLLGVFSSNNLGVLVHTLETHEGMSAYGMI